MRQVRMVNVKKRVWNQTIYQVFEQVSDQTDRPPWYQVWDRISKPIINQERKIKIEIYRETYKTRDINLHVSE